MSYPSQNFSQYSSYTPVGNYMSQAPIRTGTSSIPIEGYNSSHNIGPLAMQSYEQSLGTFGNNQNILPVTPNIFIGQRSTRVGTSSIPFPQQSYQQYSPRNIGPLAQQSYQQSLDIFNNRQNILPVNPNIFTGQRSTPVGNYQESPFEGSRLVLTPVQRRAPDEPFQYLAYDLETGETFRITEQEALRLQQQGLISSHNMNELTEEENYQMALGGFNNTFTNRQNITPINPNVYTRQQSKL